MSPRAKKQPAVVTPSPGPFTVEGENCGGGANILDARGYRIGHTAEVAEPGDREHPRVSHAEALANARLFTKAPDLAAIAQRLVDLVDCAVGTVDYDLALRTLARDAADVLGKDGGR